MLSFLGTLIIMELFNNFLILLNSVSFYLLIGLFLAGVIHEYIKEETIVKHLGSKKISNVFKAALFGLPLPICSCGVIPLSASLKKQGASKGSVVSFLTTTPMTGVDSILPTYAIFGWLITLFRVVSSLISGVLGGIITDLVDKEQPKKFSLSKPVEEKSSCCSSGGCCNSSPSKVSNRLIKILDYTINDLLKDLGKPLFIGIFLGAIFTTFFPKDLTLFLEENIILSYFLVLLFALPLYVCSVSSIPIALSLFLAGFSPGAAFIFLSAAPATSLVTISVTYKFLGKKALGIYLFSIIFVSLIFGGIIDKFFLDSINIFTTLETHEEISFLEIFSSGILLILIGYTRMKK